MGRSSLQSYKVFAAQGGVKPPATGSPNQLFSKVTFSPDPQQIIKRTDSSTPSPAQSEGLGVRPCTPRLNKPLTGEPLAQITGQAPWLIILSSSRPGTIRGSRRQVRSVIFTGADFS